jgi:F-type H+-transporting ATPase subunit a
MLAPLHQFEIKTLWPLQCLGIDFSFTNSALFMAVSVIIGVGFFGLALKNPQTIPGRYQALVEMFYQFIYNVARENLGPHTDRFFPFILGLFTFIFFGNFIGLLPFAYTITSQLVVTVSLALAVFFTVIIVGIKQHRLHFFSLFFPKGSPLLLAPLLVPIEIISFFARPISLSLRLFVNMVAGHCILKIFSYFAAHSGVIGILPFFFNLCFIGFEVMVALIQAYIFSVLSCIYLKDVLELH